MFLPLIAAALLQTHSPTPARFGHDTVITLAGSGALRDWTRGAAPDVFYVRDRTERWYRVTTTGPCPNLGTLDTLSYTTDSNGTFDRFSRLRFLRYPTVSCGVKRIVTSDVPAERGKSRNTKH